MMLTAYDPFAATNAAFRALDQLAGRAGSATARPLSGMPMDAYRVGDNFVAHFDLPGVDPGSIDLSVEGTHADRERRALGTAARERRVGDRRAPVRQLHPPAGAGPQPGHRPAGGQLPRRRPHRQHPGGREGQARKIR